VGTVSEPSLRVEGWEWLRSWKLGELQPNAGHAAVAELHRQNKLLLCVTQNTDGLHAAAGLPLTSLIQIHGSRRHVNCLRRHQNEWLDFVSVAEGKWPRRQQQVEAVPKGPYKGVDDISTSALLSGGCDFWCSSSAVLDRLADGEADPRCPRCGCILKTANISFGQQLVGSDIERAISAAVECDLLLAVGSQLSVGPVNMMLPTARRAGNRRVVVINNEPTAMDDVATVVLRGQLGDILPRLVEPDSIDSGGGKL
jgi:NAD-dependent deacetylase